MAATSRMGSENPVHFFEIQFTPGLKRRHMVTIGWSNGWMKVLLDSKLIAKVQVSF